MPVNTVEDKLHALLIAYTQSLPDKIAAIEKEWLDIRTQWNSEQFKKFHRDVHSLCGSAGTYGYMEISKSARQLEIYLKSILDKDSLSKDQQHEITQLLNAVKTMLVTDIPLKLKVSDLPSVPHEKVKENIIFIIDPQESFNKQFININESGYLFLQLADITQLSDAIRQNHPVGLIVNIDTLDHDSAKQLQNIQQQQATPIPLICTSVSGDIASRLKAIRLGNSAFLEKPLDEFYLKEMLDLHCGSRTEEAYRILIVDDSESLAEYFSLVLEEVGMVTHYITNPLLLLKAIEEFQPDLLLVDIYMPECTGLELAAILRQDIQYTKLPIIFLSTEDDRLKQLSALNLGGDDFLTKPILPKH